MNILAIETSCGRASVAIYQNKNIIAFHQDNAINMQAENLFSLIDEAFKTTGLQYNDLNYLAVTNGPGSFTGIRIGLSAAQGIILAAPHISSLVLTNFEVMAFRAVRQLCNKIKEIIVIQTASPNSLYIQTVSFDLITITEPAVINISELQDYLNIDGKKTALIGNGIKLVIDQIIDNPNLIILPRFPNIDAKLLASLAGYKLRFGKPISMEIAPLYVKPPSVKI